MSDLRAVLLHARNLYATGAEHCKPTDMPRQGVCMITACARAEVALDLRPDCHPVLALREALPREYQTLEALPREYQTLGLTFFNAERTTEECLAVFDSAIEAA